MTIAPTPKMNLAFTYSFCTLEAVINWRCKKGLGSRDQLDVK